MRSATSAVVFLLSVWVAGPLHALTLQDAVKAGLRNSHTLKEAAHGTDIEKYRRDTAQAALMPKVTSRYGYSRTDRSAGVDGRDSSSAGVAVSWNLFNGLADLNAYRSAASGYQARQFQETGLVEDYKLKVIKAYIEVLSARKKRAVATESEALLQSQLKTTRLSYKVGLFPKNEVLKVESRAVAAHRKVLEAQSKVRVAIFDLEKVTGLSLSSAVPLTDFPAETPGVPAMEQLTAMMDAHRSELKYLDTLLTSRGYDAQAAKGSWWPSLDVSAGWNHYGDSAMPDGRAYGNNDDTVARADLSWTLFDGTARKSRLASARSEVSRVQETLADTRTTLETALKRVVEDYRLAVASYDAAHSEVASARENHRVTEAMVKASSATPTDLLDANMMLTQAENSRAEARYAMYRAMAEMERAVETHLFYDGGKRFFDYD
ncbi:TolC family protein [Desulfoluna spongiiphila]|uniref:Outer membrane protein TolC n=1 Tax=Desulfoluna spongiiphila TaxID=419481 RepID=A0A1G5AR10_9BACT|nr:TolC family protein [Desulfoluna spongiiphila]SCX80260.1 Outer membrane protein TolC [Desulfoluna spongiiphila]